MITWIFLVWLLLLSMAVGYFYLCIIRLRVSYSATIAKVLETVVEYHKSSLASDTRLLELCKTIVRQSGYHEQRISNLEGNKSKTPGFGTDIGQLLE